MCVSDASLGTLLGTAQKGQFTADTVHADGHARQELLRNRKNKCTQGSRCVNLHCKAGMRQDLQQSLAAQLSNDADAGIQAPDQRCKCGDSGGESVLGWLWSFLDRLRIVFDDLVDKEATGVELCSLAKHAHYNSIKNDADELSADEKAILVEL